MNRFDSPVTTRAVRQIQTHQIQRSWTAAHTGTAARKQAEDLDTVDFSLLPGPLELKMSFPAN